MEVRMAIRKDTDYLICFFQVLALIMGYVKYVRVI